MGFFGTPAIILGLFSSWVGPPSYLLAKPTRGGNQCVSPAGLCFPLPNLSSRLGTLLPISLVNTPKTCEPIPNTTIMKISFSRQVLSN